MFYKALVALDLSPAEDALLDCLPVLHAWGTHELLLLHVVQVGYGQGAAMASARHFEDWLEQHAAPLRAAGFTVTTQVRGSGSPAEEILARATESGAALIVAGSRGQNLAAALFLGSVARELVRRSTVPLLLEWIEPGADSGSCAAVCLDPLRQVLFATDFSGCAAAATQVAKALASQARQLGCVHVAGSARAAQSARDRMDQLVDSLATPNGPARGDIIEGAVPAAIVAHAAQIDASLILLGKHGQNRLATLLVGSTTVAVCETAGRPVLVVP